MDKIFYTLQEFMIHTENISYIIMGVSLISITLFWIFLSGRDED